MSKVQKRHLKTYFYKQFDLIESNYTQKYEILNFYNFQQTEAFSLITKSLQRERHQKLMVGIGALVFAAWLMTYFPLERHQWILGILLAVSLVSGILIIYNVIRNWQIEKMPLIQLLKYEPQEIVWVYHLETQRLPFGVQFQYDCTLYFKLMNRDFIELKLPKGKVKMVSKTLNPLLPHVTFGYSPENAQWYVANPALLLKH